MQGEFEVGAEAIGSVAMEIHIQLPQAGEVQELDRGLWSSSALPCRWGWGRVHALPARGLFAQVVPSN